MAWGRSGDGHIDHPEFDEGEDMGNGTRLPIVGGVRHWPRVPGIYYPGEIVQTLCGMTYKLPTEKKKRSRNTEDCYSCHACRDILEDIEAIIQERASA